MAYRVDFASEGRTALVEAGTTLLQARIGAGLPADAPCGGKGTCGKCAIEFRGSGEAQWRRGLACRVRVDGDLEARPVRKSARMEVLTAGEACAKAVWNPMAKAVHVQVAPCPRGESLSDWSRLCDALNGALGERAWQPNARLCRDLGERLQQCGGGVWVVVCRDRVLDVRADEPQVYMAAFDLGTTTLAGTLIHVNDARTAAVGGARNPQAKYGGDVISRAEQALELGARALSDCAREAIQSLARQMCAEAGISCDRIYAALLAGNTAMHHLFLGISPLSLVRAPYNPAISAPLEMRASECGLRFHPEARLFMLPVIGGFVGADTVACLISGGWLDREKRTLMIDIGTNGELVMGDCHRRAACSTAAGPAFEGAKIECGMRGEEGAIDRVWLEDGGMRWHVIGEGAARGICGSGLVDLVAALLEAGALDDSGRLAEGERFMLGDTGVYLSQRDVREVQLAKAAIAAGIRLLAEWLGIALEEIEEVDIAGAFGNCIDPDSACAIGLIPAELRSRVVPVGNAAGEGAKLALTDEALWVSAERLARETTFLELAALPQFQDVFVDELAFAQRGLRTE